MDESEKLSRLIEHVYDAALDAARWPNALEQVCGFVRGVAANIFSQDAATNEAAVYWSWGDDPKWLPSYFETYAKLNPFFPALSFVTPGEVFSGGDIIPHEEFRQTRFYQEWVRPQGFIDVLGANLERSATTSANFSVRRSERQGVVDEETKRRFRLVLPHVRRAVTIGRVIGFQKATEIALVRMLDSLSAAVFLLGADARVVDANATAKAMLDAGDVLRAPHGKLVATEADADQALREAVRAAAGGDAGLGERGIAVTLSARAAQRLHAYVLPLTSGIRRETTDSKTVAALFVRELTLAAPTPLEMIAQRYRLTPSEIKLVSAIMEPGGIAELAARLGISRTTAKTHLGNIFAKTGTRRQADLVRLLASQGGTPGP